MATVPRLAVQALQIRSCGSRVCCVGSCSQHLLFVVCVSKVFSRVLQWPLEYFARIYLSVSTSGWLWQATSACATEWLTGIA